MTTCNSDRAYFYPKICFDLFFFSLQYCFDLSWKWLSSRYGYFHLNSILKQENKYACPSLSSLWEKAFSELAVHDKFKNFRAFKAGSLFLRETWWFIRFAVIHYDYKSNTEPHKIFVLSLSLFSSYRQQNCFVDTLIKPSNTISLIRSTI